MYFSDCRVPFFTINSWNHCYLLIKEMAYAFIIERDFVLFFSFSVAVAAKCWETAQGGFMGSFYLDFSWSSGIVLSEEMEDSMHRKWAKNINLFLKYSKAVFLWKWSFTAQEALYAEFKVSLSILYMLNSSLLCVESLTDTWNRPKKDDHCWVKCLCACLLHFMQYCLNL